MILNKLIGYDEVHDVYTNPATEEVENLPSPAFLVASNVQDGYENYGTTVERWYAVGKTLIGSVSGYRDYQAWRSEIKALLEVKAGSDYANWNNLTDEEKKIALIMVPTKIIDLQSFAFFVGQVTVLLGNGDTYIKLIDNNLESARRARRLRFDAMAGFAYAYLGKTQGLKVDELCRTTFKDELYVKRGVLYKSEDGLEGMADWLLSTAGTVFENNGLKSRIVAEEFSLGGAIDVNVFCSSLVAILENGTY